MTAPKPDTPAPAAEETAQKTAQPGKRKPKHGKGQLLTGGKPGNKGGGRHPEAYKQWMKESVSHPAAKGQVTKVLRNRDHPQFGSVYRTVLLHVLGVPGKAQEVPPDEEVSVSIDI